MRDKGTGSVFQRCEARFGCPPLQDGPPDPETGAATKVRPKHDCQGRWYAFVEGGYTANGTRRRPSVSGKSKQAVLRRLRDKRLELERHGAANTRRTITVAKWTESWLSELETKIRPSSLTTDKAAAKWIIKTIGHVKLADLTPKHVRAVSRAVRAEGLSSSTALRYHGPLIRLLKAAAVEGYTIPPNVLLTEPPAAAVSDRQGMPLADAVKILRYLQRRDDNGDLILPDSSRWSTAFLQGCRPSESLALSEEFVDVDKQLVTVCWQVQTLKYRVTGDPSQGFVVPDGFEAKRLAGAIHLVRPKSSAGWRQMPMVPWAAAAFEERLATMPANPHGLLWPGRQTKAASWPRNKANDREEFAAIQKAVGVAHPEGRPYHPHEIRHTTATLLMELKVPESIRIAILGHSTIRSTRTYEHVDIKQVRKALDSVGKILELA